jgi:predicted nucleotide-binding protein
LKKRSKKALLPFWCSLAKTRPLKAKMLARQNVVHETGLFQGRLGLSLAIVLLEDGTEEFSNIAGVQQMRFAKGNIKEAFGDVLAVLKREFGAVGSPSS